MFQLGQFQLQLDKHMLFGTFQKNLNQSQCCKIWSNQANNQQKKLQTSFPSIKSDFNLLFLKTIWNYTNFYFKSQFTIYSIPYQNFEIYNNSQDKLFKKFKILYFSNMLLLKVLYGLLIFQLLSVNSNSLEDACQSKQVSSVIDISNSKISKAFAYQYKVQTFSNPTNITLNENGELFFKGNFSKIILLNKALKKQYIYQGTKMFLRIPSMHYYSKNKSAEAQLQIVYYLNGQHNENRHKIVTMTQLYLVTKFLSKVQISLCNQISKNLQNQLPFHTSKLLKIIQKTSILMYQGTKQFYPCRNDLLCMVRKQFALINQQDLNCLKTKLKISQKDKANKKYKKFNQKNLLQISQISQRIYTDNNEL